MIEFNERCILIEKDYRENLEKLKDAYESLLENTDDPEDIRDKYNEYLDNLLNEDDLDDINKDKDRIYDEYKQIEDITNDDDNDAVSKANGIKDIISSSNIQPKSVPVSPDNKISDYNKNMDSSKVIKDSEADNFSKMLENFRYSTTPNQNQQVPSIHVAPVQVINFDQEKILEKNVNKLVKNALEKYQPSENDPKDEIDKIIAEPLVKSPLEPKAESPLEPKAESPLEPKAKSPLEPKSEPPLEPKAESLLEPKDESPLEPKDESPLEPKAEPKKKSKKKTKKKKNLRSFTIFNISRNLNCKEELNEGRYKAKDPQSAAKKAFNRYCNRTNQKEKECSYFLTVKEITRGSNSDLNTYKMMRVKLPKPIVRFAGTPKEYVNRYDTDLEAVQTPKSCYRNKLGNKSKKNN